jgi:hypothetical protein
LDPVPEEVPKSKVQVSEHSTLHSKPLKIKASSFGRDAITKNADSKGKSESHNVKF